MPREDQICEKSKSVLETILEGLSRQLMVNGERIGRLETLVYGPEPANEACKRLVDDTLSKRLEEVLDSTITHGIRLDRLVGTLDNQFGGLRLE